MTLFGVDILRMRLGSLISGILTISAPVYADDRIRATRADSEPFTDAESLSIPSGERRLMAEDSVAFFGVRASSAIADGAPQKSGPNVVAALAFDVSRHSFAPTRALYLGFSEYGAASVALGYGYQLGVKYEAGAILTTDKGGSGAFLRIGGEGETRASGRALFAKVWGYPALGYSLQRQQARVEFAILPSLGGMSVPPAALDLAEPFWVRQRVRARLWHVLVDIEHGQQAHDDHNAAYWQGALCASTGRIPLLACTSAVLFDRSALPLASLSEVSIAVGFGALREESTFSVR